MASMGPDDIGTTVRPLRTATDRGSCVKRRAEGYERESIVDVKWPVFAQDGVRTKDQRSLCSCERRNVDVSGFVDWCAMVLEQ